MYATSSSRQSTGSLISRFYKYGKQHIEKSGYKGRLHTTIQRDCGCITYNHNYIFYWLFSLIKDVVVDLKVDLISTITPLIVWHDPWSRYKQLSMDPFVAFPRSDVPSTNSIPCFDH